jgi:predicted MFS family arabinose efflux permease
LVQILSAPGAVLVDAVSFAWSAVFLWRIKGPEPERYAKGDRRPLLVESMEGLRAVIGNPVLRMLTVATVIVAMGQRIVGVLFLIYLVDDVGFEPGVLGIIFAVGGVTSLAGAWLAGQQWVERRLGLAMIVAVLAGALGMLGMPLAESVGVAGISFLVANQLISDPATTFFEIHELSIRQQATGDEVLGRVNAAVQFLALAGALAGTGLAALLGEVWDARTGLFAAFGILMVAPLVLVFSGSVRGAGAPPVRVTEVTLADSPG